MEVSALSGFLTNVGTVITSMTGWAGDFGSTIVSTPALLVPFVLGISFTAVGLFKSMR